MVSNCLVLSEDLSIYHAQEQKQLLLDALAGTDKLELDLSAVTDIDSSGLQLLILAKREALQQNKQLIIMASSPVVTETISFCRLTAFFEKQPDNTQESAWTN